MHYGLLNGSQFSEAGYIILNLFYEFKWLTGALILKAIPAMLISTQVLFIISLVYGVYCSTIHLEEDLPLQKDIPDRSEVINSGKILVSRFRQHFFLSGR